MSRNVVAGNMQFNRILSSTVTHHHHPPAFTLHCMGRSTQHLQFAESRTFSRVLHATQLPSWVCQSLSVDGNIPESSAAGKAQDSSADAVMQQGAAQQQQLTKPSRWQFVQGFLHKYGPGAFLSYITVSNALSVGMLSTAWIIFTRTTGCTPLHDGQWPKFLMYYAGAWAVQHMVRPFKLAVGLAGTAVGSALVDGMARMLGRSKNVSLVVLLVLEAAALLCCLAAVAVYANSLVAVATA